jgi:hypothetical protein
VHPRRGQGNHALIDETSLSAISDLLLACPDVVEGSTSDILALFDDIPLGPYMARAKESYAAWCIRGTLWPQHALSARQTAQGRLSGGQGGKPRQDRPCEHQRDREGPRCVPEGRPSHREGEDRDRPPVARQKGSATARPFRAVAAGIGSQFSHGASMHEIRQGRAPAVRVRPDLPVAVQ